MYGRNRPENSGRWLEGGSSIPISVSDDRIFPVLVRTGHNLANPVTGYDHSIPASTFLPLSGVFRPETTSFLRVPAGNPRNRVPELSNWANKDRSICFKCGQQHIYNLEHQNKVCCVHCKGDCIAGNPNCPKKIETRELKIFQAKPSSSPSIYLLNTNK